MFDFSKFVQSALMDGVHTGESRYNVGLRSIPFYQNGVLTDENMVELDEALTKRDEPKCEPLPEIDMDMQAVTQEKTEGK